MINGSIPRRQFLRCSATTVAGLACGIPGVLPGSALGFGRTAPSERVTLGFIGLGWKGFEGCWGSLLQTFIADRSCQVLAVCDVDRRYLDRAKKYVDQTYPTDCPTRPSPPSSPPTPPCPTPLFPAQTPLPPEARTSSRETLVPDHPRPGDVPPP